MSNTKLYEEKTEQLITPLLEERGFELVDVEYVKEANEYYLRVYMDKEGGITIDDCVDVSRAFNEILDREDYISDAYIFEVSSPGLDRPLKKDKDFERSIGERVLVKTYQKIDKSKEFYGYLKAYDDSTVTIECEEKDMTIDRKNISIVRLAYEFD
jgi:ribosome maturation factor RimP